MKCDVLKGLALGHRTGAHGENPREELEPIKPYFRVSGLEGVRGLNNRIREVANSDAPIVQTCGQNFGYLHIYNIGNNEAGNKTSNIFSNETMTYKFFFIYKIMFLLL
jgi:hypothetical protein